MQISYPNAAAALTGTPNVTSTSIVPGPIQGAATLMDVEASIANPGVGLDSEASEPLASIYVSTAPPAIAAPTPISSPQGGDSTGEPVSMYSVPPDGA